MSNIELNRLTVQEGLDHRAAQRVEDALDADARNLRVVCNRKAEARRNEAQAVQAARRRMEAREAAQARWEANRNTFLLRTFCPLVIPAIMCILLAFGIVHYVPALIVAIAAGLFIVVNFVAYATRNRKEREALAKAWQWIVAMKDKIFAPRMSKPVKAAP